MKRWAWVWEELADLQRADADEVRRQAEEEAAPPAPRRAPEPPHAPADEVVDLGLMTYEDALAELGRTAPPRVRRTHPPQGPFVGV